LVNNLRDAHGHAGAEHLATYGDSTTTFDHADWLGTERYRTTAAGGFAESCQSLVFGDGFSCTADMSPLHFTGKEHDYESNLENFGARYYSSQYGRFVTPDWSSVPAPVPYADLTNPQSLNQYVIVADDPSSFADLDGHDFNVGCTAREGAEKSCQGGFLGTTDPDGNFTRTVITSASLSDPNSGNTATVNENGVQITTPNGMGEGVFIANTPAADVQGSGAFQDFEFKINGNCSGTCLDSGTFQFNGTPDQTRDLLDDRGAFRSIVDRTIPILGKSIDEMRYHPDTTQARFGDGPSPHFSVPRDPGNTIPMIGPFHVDIAAPSLAHLACATLGVECQ
jgi:RHS repeat-associated protein